MNNRVEAGLGQDLFTYQGDQELKRNAPLADRLRPTTLDDFVGQSAILAEGRLLRRAITADRVGNLLLHGPPGVGKTTLARIIAANTRSHFSVLNAVLAGVKELRQEVEQARGRLDRHRLRTILFIDEVHRFNSAQQDALLPWVENGTLTLIGATTENPYFEVNKALLSRSRLFRLQTLEPEDLHQLLDRALLDKDKGFGNRNVSLKADAANHLVDVANGDARSLLNALELAVESTPPDTNGFINIDLNIAEESIQQRAVLYDKQGDAHFDTISAFIKSLRGSDPDAALFWLARMIEAGENPRYIFRRMLIAASEDVGLADPQAIVVVESCATAFERIGLPEGLYSLAQAALYLSVAEKSNSILGFFEAQRTVREAQKQIIPTHLRDPHRDGKTFGDGIDYKYPHAFAEHWVNQQYLPKELQGEIFWKPSQQGWEGKRRFLILERRAAQLATAVESENQYPLFLSNGPRNNELDSWLQRQLTNEGNRLQKLLERLWMGVPWQRNDRVLVIGGRSLLWALTPLSEVPEGGVTILSSSKNDLSRLKAQIEILDPICRPDLIHEDLVRLGELPANCQFEWIGGRLYNQDFASERINNVWTKISNKCSSNAGLRLLITHSICGPAKSLIKLLDHHEITDSENSILSDLVQLEENWLNSLRQENVLLEKLLELGWIIKWESWEESITLQIDEHLETRWLGEGNVYRNFLAKNTSQEVVSIMHNLLKRMRGKSLPQNLIHKKIIGSLKSS